MTSEVLLMNLEAVVLGSDSAATMFDANGRPFSQSGVDKIFVIHQTAPVAAMVYGGGQFAGYPWKTVLDDFARGCGPQSLSMRSYAEKLLTYLSGFGDGALSLETEVEQAMFALYLRAFLLDYRLWLDILGWKPAQPLAADLAAAALAPYSRQVLYLEPDGEGQDLTPRPRLEAGTRLNGFLGRYFAATFAREMGLVFAGVTFPQNQVEPLIKLAVQSLLVEWLPIHAGLFATGLVLAGFGAGASVPSMVSMEFFGPFGGIIKYHNVLLKTPRAGVAPAIIETFAQADLTQAFLHGAMPGYEDNSFRVMAHLLSGLVGDVLKAAAPVDKGLTARLQDMLRDVPYQFPAFAAHLARQVRNNEVIDKLWPSISAANSDMLAKTAQQFMDIPITEHALLRDGSVGRPVVVLSMAPGRLAFIRDGVAS